MVDAVGSDPSRLSVSGAAAPDSLGFFHPSVVLSFHSHKKVRLLLWA